MRPINDICVDAGTVNCPCILAETGDCLICSRLSGKEKCDCSWCGICIYNEFRQNDSVAVNIRKAKKAPIINKKWYGKELAVIEIGVDKETALRASTPGSFVFLSNCEDCRFYAPISVYRRDARRGSLSFAINVRSAKSRAICNAEESLFVKGIYRSGLLGAALGDEKVQNGKWLIFAKGTGLAPAANLLHKRPAGTFADMVIDTEKITGEFLEEFLSEEKPEDVMIAPLSEARALGEGRIGIGNRVYDLKEYDKVAILASDYYIETLSRAAGPARDKLIYSNNAHMCCGEGICGACCHIDEEGREIKICKSRQKK